MTTINVALKDASGNYLYPKTKAEIVENAAGETLEDVEAGAQVNVIEKITFNGTEVNITDKTAAITVEDASEYTIEKAAAAEDGYASSYILTKDGTQIGDTINIPKDMVVESGTVETCITADSPVEGYAVGDKYIDLVLANADDQHIYILVSDLVDTYTAGDYITISSNTISVDADSLTSALDETFVTESELTSALGSYVTSDGLTTTLASYITYEELTTEE